MKLFAVTKIADDEKRIVEGVASTEVIDSQDEIVSLSAIKAALPDYLEWGNIREMHQPIAVGTVLNADIVDDKFTIRAKVVDNDAWLKVKEGVYKGFSIGGSARKHQTEKHEGKSIRRITELDLTEISLVDRPANPQAKIALWKVDNPSDKIPEEETLPETSQEKNVVDEPNNPVAKGEPTADMIIAALQSMRLRYETQHKLFSSMRLTEAIRCVVEASLEADYENTPYSKVEKAGATFSKKNAALLRNMAETIFLMLKEAGYEDVEMDTGEDTEAQKLYEAIESSQNKTINAFHTLRKEVTEKLDRVISQPVGSGPVLTPVSREEPTEKLLEKLSPTTRRELNELDIVERIKALQKR